MLYIKVMILYIFKEEEDIYVANINKHVLYSSLKHELIIYFNVQYFMHMSKVTMTVTLLLAVSFSLTKSSVCVNVVNNMCNLRLILLRQY